MGWWSWEPGDDGLIDHGSLRYETRTGFTSGLSGFSISDARLRSAFCLELIQKELWTIDTGLMMIAAMQRYGAGLARRCDDSHRQC